jgi:hypothetical protein
VAAARWHLHKETTSFSKQEKHPACHHVNYSDYYRSMTIVSHVGRGGVASDGRVGFTDILSLPGERKGGKCACNCRESFGHVRRMQREGWFSGYERYTVLKPHDLKMRVRVFISECVMKTPHNEVGEPCCRLRGNRGL